MNRNVRCNNFLALRTGPTLTTPPLRIIITVCHKKATHTPTPLPLHTL